VLPLRRFLLLLLALATILAVVLLALPWWLGPALRRTGASRGLSFARYERVGYGRFMLTDVRYQRPGLEFAAARVEAPQPLAWLWEHYRGSIGELVVADWNVHVTPAPAAPSSTTPSGWSPVRRQLETTVDTLAAWLPRARLEKGAVVWTSGEATVKSVTWRDRRLVVHGAKFRGNALDATIAAPARSNEISVTLASLDRPLSVTAESRDATVVGSVKLAGNVGHFELTFAATGWTPQDATFAADAWSVPGTDLGLAQWFGSVAGGAQIDWHSGAFSVDTHLRGDPAATRKVPPLEVELRAHGNRQAITVQALRVQAPAMTARLSEPATFDFHGNPQGSGAVFVIDADLAQLPGSKLAGTVHGRAEVISALNAAPAVSFDVQLQNVAAAGVAIQQADARGEYRWPTITVKQGRLKGAAGETLAWQGSWDFASKRLSGATLRGELRRATLARFVPANIQFGTVNLQAAAEGPLDAVRSNGTVHVADLVLPGLRPAALAATWKGVGAAIDAFSAQVRIAHTELKVAGSATNAQIELRDLELAQNGHDLLKLQQPAAIAFQPALSIRNLRLAGPAASLIASGQAGNAGRLELAATGLDASWAADVLTNPVHAAKLESLAVTAQWHDGPATFSLGATATTPLPSGQIARLNLAARGDAAGVEIEALRVSEADATVANATGGVPVTLWPGAQPLVHLDMNGAVALKLQTAPHAEFWRRLGSLIGVTIEQPAATLDLAGTLNRPKGQLVLRVGAAHFDPQRFHRPMPSLTAVDVEVTANEAGIELERFGLRVEGQSVAASGHVPFPAGGWQALRGAPLDALRANADLHVVIAHATIAAFQPFAAKVLAPTGALTVDATYRHGALSGIVQLRGAATQSLGPLGIVRDISADLALDGRTLTIRSAKAQSGGHLIQLGGTIALPVKAGPKFDVAIAADNVPFVRETGLLVRGDVDLKLRTAEDGATDLTGAVRLRDSIFMRDFQSLAPHGGGGGGGATPPYFSVTAAPMNAWRVDVKVTGDRFLRIETPVFAGLASLDFQLRGTLGAPRATGSVRLDRGQVMMPFATFAVQHGTVSLTEADPVQPKLDIAAATRKYGYDLKLSVTGTADEPNVEFTSSPPLPSDQILLLVMAGVAPNNEIATSNTSRAVAIGAYLGKGLLGAGGGGENRLKIDSGADISEQGKPTYSISYQLSPRWTAIGEYSRFDEYVADAKWQLWPKPKDDGTRPPKRAKDAAKIEVKGVGWLRGRKLRGALERIIGPAASTLDTNAIEDAAVMLLSAVKDEGYQDARLDLKVTRPDGSTHPFAFDPTFADPLPTTLQAKGVEFDVSTGARWHVTSAGVTGATAISEDQARSYFYTHQALFDASANAYSPSRLASAAGSLRSELQRRGYVDAKVTAQVDHVEHGAVAVAVTVDQGAQWRIGRVEFSRDASAGVTFPDVKSWLGQPLAPTLKTDIRNRVRQAYYRAGYPDTEVAIETSPLHRNGGRIEANVRVNIDARPRVTVGQVRFKGNEHTKTSVLRSRVDLRSGQPLDVLALEKARYRISRLGVFDDVSLHYEPNEGAVRDPVFTVDEAPRFKTSLLAGYGSYEQLRAGIEAREQNLFGHAHQARLRFVQSMKSTDADFTYTIPELLGEDIDGTAELYALRRREIAFLRKEFGASFALQRRLPSTGGMASLRYGLGALANSRNALVTRATDRSQINVGSLTLSVSGDRRDHPLDPRHGYNWLTRLEAASPIFGGVARFQRLELSGGYHTGWGSGRWIHLGLSHGVVTTLDGNDATLPVNRRFYPGGANSIRGYQNGEAAPRDADGRFRGAKTFTLLNVELEQAITPSLSAVAFGDALGESASLSGYPWQEKLYSIGLGLRYRTPVGPIRVEYGRNVNPRPYDPSGTLQLSIGYPF